MSDQTGQPGQPAHSAQPGAAGSDSRGILNHSAVMAAGTVVSRLSGFARSGLLLAALGNTLHADVFNVANTIPNMLYILLAGGIFNAVLVPQLVRSMEGDPDRGEAYTNRVITLAALFLAAVTALLVLAAPLLLHLYLSSAYYTPAHSTQLESVIDFTRLCLPQVFFYGMYVLVGQVLNARGRFGPMMWAPIANNVIAVVVLAIYLVTYGAATEAERSAGYSTGQEWLLGLGSTLGIVAQLVVLVPYLRSAGLVYRPRYDFRGTGLGHTLRLGGWTVLFVVVNQIAYAVVVYLASSGPAEAAHNADATGYTIYANTFLIMMVPHSVVTVSLATAVLPRLSRYAAGGDLQGLGRTLGVALRSALAVVVPFALLLPLIARDLAHSLFGWFGLGASSYGNFAPSLSLIGIGLVFFTVHYLSLRGFYALEQNRTVFFVQCAIAAVNIVAALVLVHRTSSTDTSPALVVAYAASYLVGSAVSLTVLRRRLGGLGGALPVRFAVRLLVVAVAAAAVAGAVAWLLQGLGDGLGAAVLRLVVVVAVDIGLFLGLARAFRMTEVTDVMDTITRRLPSRKAR